MLEFNGEWRFVYLIITILTAIGGALAFVWRTLRELSKSRINKEKADREEFREDFIAFRDAANDEIERLKKELDDVRADLKAALEENKGLKKELASLKRQLRELEKNTSPYNVSLNGREN